MTITSNREGLKSLANFNIDAQFCQQYGSQVFNYQGDSTEKQYQQTCLNLDYIIDDLISSLQIIKTQIPRVAAD